MRIITTRSEALGVQTEEKERLIGEALEYATFLREPRLLLMCDKELENGLRQSIVECYIDICKTLDYVPFSMTWNLDILLKENENEKQAPVFVYRPNDDSLR